MNQIATNGTTNGNGKRQTSGPNLYAPLPQSKLERFEAGLHAFYESEAMIERLQREKEELVLTLKERDVEIETLKNQMATFESRAHSCQIERDAAVARQAQRETVLMSIQHLLVQAGVPPIEEEPVDQEDHQQH